MLARSHWLWIKYYLQVAIYVCCTRHTCCDMDFVPWSCTARSVVSRSVLNSGYYRSTTVELVVVLLSLRDPAICSIWVIILRHHDNSYWHRSFRTAARSSATSLTPQISSHSSLTELRGKTADTSFRYSQIARYSYKYL